MDMIEFLQEWLSQLERLGANDVTKNMVVKLIEKERRAGG